MTIKTATFTIAKIRTLDQQAMGKVEYTCTVIGKVGKEKYEADHVVNYRPGIDYLYTNKAIPVDYIKAHIESMVRKDFEMKEKPIAEVIIECNL